VTARRVTSPLYACVLVCVWTCVLRVCRVPCDLGCVLSLPTCRLRADHCGTGVGPPLCDVRVDVNVVVVEVVVAVGVVAVVVESVLGVAVKLRDCGDRDAWCGGGEHARRCAGRHRCRSGASRRGADGPVVGAVLVTLEVNDMAVMILMVGGVVTGDRWGADGRGGRHGGDGLGVRCRLGDGRGDRLKRRRSTWSLLCPRLKRCRGGRHGGGKDMTIK
jgi:hypothetical protein